MRPHLEAPKKWVVSEVMGLTPSSPPFSFGIFHDLNDDHPAIGVPMIGKSEAWFFKSSFITHV